MVLPSKETHLLEKIKTCIESGQYLDTRHASQRKTERSITRPDIIYVLLNGHHEAKKDKYELSFQAWNYSIRGKTIDNENLRVIISFDENGMLIITAIRL